MSSPRLSTVRGILFAGGIVLIGIVGKVVVLGMGNGTFRIADWELVVLAVVGAALITIGWQRAPGHSANRDDELNEDVDPADEP
jgi:hypothetical protein